ncbi:MAG: radical SAM protein [Syntrophaceae bacterium]|nr:radical SAM protein [Syntrophaceae bacterium]
MGDGEASEWGRRVVFRKIGAQGERECQNCNKEKGFLSQTLPFCIDCLRSGKETLRPFIEKAHHRSREPFQLVPSPPRNKFGISCQICVNQCEISEGAWGYCGLRTQREGVLEGTSSEKGNVSWYYDPLPTNCVADWVCPGGTGTGYPQFAFTSGPEYGFKNLAVFYHGCSFDCLFCQNWNHREMLWNPRRTTPDELAQAVDEKTSCICYFGGDPTPQLPHALQASKKAIKKTKGRILRICWETNGSMNPKFLEEMVDLSLTSGGCIKFDIKAWNDSLHFALCGVSNERTKRNFEEVASWTKERPEPPLLIASTLLIPGYMDEEEVRGISKWIASLNPEIPYALLAFYPQFFFKDLPVTSRKFAFRCQEVAEGEGLRRVRVGNMHLL